MNEFSPEFLKELDESTKEMDREEVDNLVKSLTFLGRMNTKYPKFQKVFASSFLKKLFGIPI